MRTYKIQPIYRTSSMSILAVVSVDINVARSEFAKSCYAKTQAEFIVVDRQGDVSVLSLLAEDVSLARLHLKVPELQNYLREH